MGVCVAAAGLLTACSGVGRRPTQASWALAKQFPRGGIFVGVQYQDDQTTLYSITVTDPDCAVQISDYAGSLGEAQSLAHDLLDATRRVREAHATQNAESASPGGSPNRTE